MSQGNAAGSLDLAVDPRLSGLIESERRGGNMIASEREVVVGGTAEAGGGGK